MALLNLVYRDQLFPRDAYRLTFDRLLEQLPERRPAASWSICWRSPMSAAARPNSPITGAELAAAPIARHRRLARPLRAGSRRAARVVVHLAPLIAYEALLGAGLTREKRHEDEQRHRRRPARAAAQRAAPARHQADWPDFAERADKEGWPAARFLAALPNTRSPNATAAASSAISPRPGCCRARPSTASTSTPCR